MPQAFGAYDVVGLVAEGATGRVFRTRHRELGRDAAVKVLSPAVAALPGMVDRLRREAAVLAGLSHPHIVDLYDFVEDDPDPWLAEQWVDGAPLAAILGAVALTPEQAVGVVRGALSGLAHAHDHQVVHRDVSTSNVVADLEGTSMLVDFGVAARVDDAPSGTVVGTPAYLSPEGAQGRVVGKAGDVYSCAAVLFELLAGRPPFAGSLAEVLRQHVEVDAPRLDDAGPHLADLVARALAKDPDARPQDAGAFLRELDEAAEHRFGTGWLARSSIAGLVTAVATPAGVFASARDLASGAGSGSGDSSVAVVDVAEGGSADSPGRSAARTGRSLTTKAAVAGVAALVVVAGAATVAAVTRSGEDRSGAPAGEVRGAGSAPGDRSSADAPAPAGLSIPVGSPCGALSAGAVRAVLGQPVKQSQELSPGDTRPGIGVPAQRWECSRAAEQLRTERGDVISYLPRAVVVAVAGRPISAEELDAQRAALDPGCEEIGPPGTGFGDAPLTAVRCVDANEGGTASVSVSVEVLLGEALLSCFAVMPQPEAGGLEQKVHDLCLGVARSAAGA